MPRPPKLNPAQWEKARVTWESDPRDGFEWLIRELKLPVTRPAIGQHAKKAVPPWAKKTGEKEGGESPDSFPGKPAKVSLPKPVTFKPEPQKVVIGSPTDSQIVEALEGLNPNEIAFAEAYLVCFNGTRAWMEVYGTTKDNTAAKAASDKLRSPKVREYLAKRMTAAFADSEAAKGKLINTLQAVAYGDANELVEYRRESCRYCHGEGHLYQYTPAEYKRSEADAKENGEEFDGGGGSGFNPRLDPHPDCPECHGDGVGRVFFKDSRKLSPAGLALYAGAKVGKDGIEVKMASQEKARDTLGRILKLYDDTSSTVTINLDTITLEEKFVSRMREAHERQAKVMAERGLLPD